MDYGLFDAERRRLVAWLSQGPADPAVASSELNRLRSMAGEVAGEADRAKAMRYVDTLQAAVAATFSPRYDALAQADAIMRAAQRSEGDPATRRAQVRQAVLDIAGLAESAASESERGAVLDLNESLLELVALLDRQLAADVTGRPASDRPVTGQ